MSQNRISSIIFWRWGGQQPKYKVISPGLTCCCYDGGLKSFSIEGGRLFLAAQTSLLRVKFVSKIELEGKKRKLFFFGMWVAFSPSVGNFDTWYFFPAGFPQKLSSFGPLSGFFRGLFATVFSLGPHKNHPLNWYSNINIGLLSYADELQFHDGRSLFLHFAKLKDTH